MAVAATASGGATTAPSAKAAATENGFGTTHNATSATHTVVNNVAPTDSTAIADRFARKSTSEVRMAAAYSSGGRTPTSTSSGSSRTCGTNGRYAPATPTPTSTSGAEAPIRRDAPATATTTSVRMTRETATCTAPS